MKKILLCALIGVATQTTLANEGSSGGKNLDTAASSIAAQAGASQCTPMKNELYENALVHSILRVPNSCVNSNQIESNYSIFPCLETERDRHH
jgi:hypothetical protein